MIRSSALSIFFLFVVLAAAVVAAPEPPPAAADLRLVVRVRAVAGGAVELRRLLESLVEPTRREPGCLTYEIHESTVTPGRFVLEEHWVDAAALEAHLASPHFLAVSGRIEGSCLLAAPPEVAIAGRWSPLAQFLEGLARERGVGAPAGEEIAGEPRLFAPGSISTGAYELNAAFTADGETVYFTRALPVFPFPNDFSTILSARRLGDSWSRPEVVGFSGVYSDIDPYLSPDGSRLYYMSNRPLEGKEPNGDFDLWYVERSGDGWGDPRHLGPVVNSEWWDGYPAVAANGNLYFFSGRPGGSGPVDIYRASRQGEGYETPVNLGEAINSTAFDTNVYVAPDESYLIFSSSRLSPPDDPMARMDLFVSFRDADGWTRAESLGELVNTPGWEFTPMVDPAGERLYFTRAVPPADRRHGDARRLDYDAFERLVDGPLNGLGDIFVVDLAALRPDWR